MILQFPKKTELPTIDIKERNLPVISEEAWKALIQANSPPRIFYHADRWVRVLHQKNGRIRLEELDGKKLRHELARQAVFVFKEKIDLPPHFLVDDLLSDPFPRLPVLKHIAPAPLFSKGGDLRVQPGYDPETQCYRIDFGARRTWSLNWVWA